MAEELLAIGQRLAEIGRRFDDRNWVLGTSGNFSVVLQRSPLRLAITSSGVSKGALTPDQILDIDEDLAVIQGTGQPSAEARLHLEVARARGLVHDLRREMELDEAGRGQDRRLDPRLRPQPRPIDGVRQLVDAGLRAADDPKRAAKQAPFSAASKQPLANDTAHHRPHFPRRTGQQRDQPFAFLDQKTRRAPPRVLEHRRASGTIWMILPSRMTT